MGILIYGQSKTIIGIDEVLVRCPSCEKSSWADIMVESKYYHIYWLPIFPFDKTVNIFCNECGLKRYELPFISTFIPTYPEIKHRFRHPIKTYSFLIIVIALVLVAIFT
jgi:hypothetical protein